MWIVFALLSAFFAALTAILAKVGVSGIDSNLATAIRTSVILVLTWAIALAVPHAGGGGIAALRRRHRRPDGAKLALPDFVGAGDGALVALLFQGAAARGCLEGGAHRQTFRGFCDCAGDALSARTGRSESAGGRRAHPGRFSRDSTVTRAPAADGCAPGRKGWL